MKTLRLKNSKTHRQVKKKPSLLCVIQKHYPFSRLGGLPRKVRFAFLFMEENYHRKIGLWDVAEVVGLSPKSLCNMIRREMKKRGLDITCMEYLDYLRVKKLIEIFKEYQNIKCHAVADRLGIKERNFRDIFNKFIGMSPSEFRNENF